MLYNDNICSGKLYFTPDKYYLMHRSYEELKKHKADFRVKYKFKSTEDGGRKQSPFQGYRSDFSYSENSSEPAYMIFPEFEDTEGNVILENDRPVPKEGTARMWIVDPERRPIHQARIKVGEVCFFREGHILSAKCEVIEIIALFENPVKF